VNQIAFIFFGENLSEGWTSDLSLYFGRNNNDSHHIVVMLIVDVRAKIDEAATLMMCFDIGRLRLLDGLFAIQTCDLTLSLLHVGETNDIIM